MKPNNFFLILCIFTVLFSSSFLSAVEFEMKNSFDQGETLFAKVSGNFIEPILKENIFFYRGHVRIPMEYDVAKINDEFYIYALLAKPEENYSIIIKNVKYMKGAEISEEEIVREFSITNKTADFSVTPGFILTDTDFSVEVQNLQDEKINITVNGESSIVLKSGEIENLKFELSNSFSEEFSLLELSSENLKYEIPVYLFSVDEPEEIKERKFKLEPSTLDFSMPTDSETKRILYLYNTGEATLENISFLISESLEDYITFSVEDFEELEPNESVRIELDFQSPSKEENVKGKLIVEQEELQTYTDIEINFVKDFVPENEEDIEEEIIIVSETCAERNGTICEKDKECNGEKVYAKDDVCCLGTCGEIKKSSTGKIIGWSMIGLVVLFLIWFLKVKYRGARKEINLFDIGKRR